MLPRHLTRLDREFEWDRLADTELMCGVHELLRAKGQPDLCIHDVQRPGQPLGYGPLRARLIRPVELGNDAPIDRELAGVLEDRVEPGGYRPEVGLMSKGRLSLASSSCQAASALAISPWAFVVSALGS